MGKLHTLRRAIERDPDHFMDKNGPSLRASSAFRYFRRKGDWRGRPYWASSSYRPYVRKVLRSLGYVVQ